MLDEFKSDWRKISVTVTDTSGQDNIQRRDYYNILKEGYNTVNAIYGYRESILTNIYETINQPQSTPEDIIDQIFKSFKPNSKDLSNKVRFINAIKTTLKGDLVGMFVADDICNMFVDIGTSIMWYTFDSTHSMMEILVNRKVSSDNKEYQYEPKMKFTQYSIVYPGEPENHWLFKMLNRDFTKTGRSKISDTFAIHCYDQNTDQYLWYVPQLNSYIYGAPSTGGVFDMVYEQYGDRLYVLFNGDNHVYAYDNVAETRTFEGFVVLKKETANLKLATFNSMCITDDELCFDRMFLDYFQSNDGRNENQWNIVLYGRNDTKNTFNEERWYYRPGSDKNDYRMYNSIVFGDSLFDLGQLRFHNISKNKDMYDILDVNEVDGRYYGLFKNENPGTEILGNPTYTVFKAEKEGGVVQRLPWQILNPHMFRTNDSLYSLYVVSNEPTDEERELGKVHPVLREISVPDSDEYPERVIDIDNLYKTKNGEDASDYE